MFLGSAQVLTSLGSTATVVTADLLIKTITFTTSGIFSLGKALLTPASYMNYKQLQELENDIDLFETIRIYELYIKEILEKEKEFIDSSESIKTTIQSIHTILNDLHLILQEIDKKVEYHKTIWFQSLRTLDFTKEIHDIKYKKNILDSRFNILQKIYKK